MFKVHKLGIAVATALLMAGCSLPTASPVAFVENSEVDLTKPGLFSNAGGGIDLRRRGGAPSVVATGPVGVTEERVIRADGTVVVRRVTVEETAVQ